MPRKKNIQQPTEGERYLLDRMIRIESSSDDLISLYCEGLEEISSVNSAIIRQLDTEEDFLRFQLYPHGDYRNGSPWAYSLFDKKYTDKYPGRWVSGWDALADKVYGSLKEAFLLPRPDPNRPSLPVMPHDYIDYLYSIAASPTNFCMGSKSCRRLITRLGQIGIPPVFYVRQLFMFGAINAFLFSDYGTDGTNITYYDFPRSIAIAFLPNDFLRQFTLMYSEVSLDHLYDGTWGTIGSKSISMFQKYMGTSSGRHHPRDIHRALYQKIMDEANEAFYGNAMFREAIGCKSARLGHDPILAAKSILGISSNKLTRDDVNDAYRACAKQHHPDINNSPDAHETFIKIKEAYDLLSQKLEL